MFRRFDAYIANVVTLASVNLVEAKSALMWVGQFLLVCLTAVFTYYKVRKMRAEALEAERKSQL